MILVDTSVWIDFLSGRPSSAAEVLAVRIQSEEDIGYTGFILQELLQGCADERAAVEIVTHFQPFLEIFPQRSSYELAARIFRRCRAEGFTIRSSVDCLIAACAIEQDCWVHHQDRDFGFIERVCGLKVLKI